MRGDILEAVRRVGFAAEGKIEQFLVLQADEFAEYERIVIAPLDDAAYHVNNPLAVEVRPGMVVLIHHLCVVSREKLAPRPVAHVRRLDEVDRVLGAFLGISPFG